MTSRDLSKAMEKSNFKTASLGYFSELATKAKDADESVGRLHSRLKEATKDMATYGVIGSALYGGVNALRGGINASAEYQREIFRQENASIPKAEQLRIARRGRSADLAVSERRARQRHGNGTPGPQHDG